MSGKTPSLTVTACIIERPHREVLICRPKSAPDVEQPWEFPTGIKRQDESHETAARRACLERLGVHIEVQVGQPPFVADYGGRLATYRFFIATVISGEAKPIEFDEIRWVQVGQLCEYDFDKAHKPVVDWYVS